MSFLHHHRLPAGGGICSPRHKGAFLVHISTLAGCVLWLDATPGGGVQHTSYRTTPNTSVQLLEGSGTPPPTPQFCTWGSRTPSGALTIRDATIEKLCFSQKKLCSCALVLLATRGMRCNDFCRPFFSDCSHLYIADSKQGFSKRSSRKSPSNHGETLCNL